MSHVSRPIKRGRLFGNLVPRKPQLSRHFKNLEFIFNIHEFEVYYWVSFAKQNGVEMQGKNFQMTVCKFEKCFSVIYCINMPQIPTNSIIMPL